VHVLAPHGIGDLVRLIVRLTLAFARKMSAYKKKDNREGLETALAEP
jgi:hypothetical protein